MFNPAKNSPGFSLVELMVAVSVLSIFLLAAISAFLGIGRGILVSKTRTIATNLTQEKIESLKDISYPRLLVTSSSDLLNYGYDNTNYSPETIVVADTNFTRRVVIHKVREGSDGKLEELSPAATDTDLKKIKVTVVWSERGEERSLTLSNLRENPDRKATDSIFNGTVYKSPGGGGNALADARIYVEENLNWETYAGTDGTYSLRVSSGTWHLKATKPGYWDARTDALSITKGETKTENLTLTEKAKGNAYGVAYIVDHLVISEVCADSGGLEYVELYNPTTWTWTLNSSTLKLKRIEPDYTAEEIPLSFINNTLPTQKYFLLLGSGDGSTTTLTGILANATYYAVIEPEDRGIAIQDASGLAIDTATWTTDLVPNYCRERFSYPLGILPGYGNAYDTNDNADFSLHSGLNPENTSTSEPPISGAPAVGAIVSCNDGLSSQAVASATGYWYISGIATGTWTIVVSSRTLYREIYNNYIRPNITTGTPNGSTQPSWTYSDWPAVLITSQPADGFVSGRVFKQQDGSPLGGIYVYWGVSYSPTDSQGQYWLQVPPGDYQITANPTSPSEYYNSNYTSSTTATITVNVGQISVVPDITLSAAGVVRGKVTSNGTDPLPDIVVSAYDNYWYQVATVLSNSQGEYSFSQLSTGGNTYHIKPELDAGESFSTVSYSTNPVPVIVVQGSTIFVDTFTVSSAYGKITGTVSESGERIKTGVLIMATTATISSEPPTINSTLRGSGAYYYATVSLSDGTYELPVRGRTGSYKVYAWYTKLNETVTTTTRKDGTATVSAGQTVSLDFTWP